MGCRRNVALNQNKEVEQMANIMKYIDGSSPMMERFKEVAPGTYRHCINVGQLCESVAKELHLDAEVLQVAGALHDIGKCNNPGWFSENQEPDKNPHDDTEPNVSFQIISRHVADSVMRLVQMGVPTNIIHIISEHHGDTVVGAIYAKAKSKYNGDTIEDHYRYRSSKPTTPESCVLMLCDVVEATCRSLYNNDKLVSSRDTIDKIVNGLIDDEQLDVLTIGDIRVIKRVMFKEIDSFFHKRVDYDDEAKNGNITNGD
jgi:putative nucleotidyltransferase with HDIG domain